MKPMKDKKEKQVSEVPVFIEGKIISFIPQNSEYISLYAKWMNNPIVRKYARWEMPRRIEDFKRWFEPREGWQGFIGFDIWHNKDKKPIGQVGLVWIDWVNGWANAFLFIGEPEYWGKNIATEATELLIEYAFNELNLNKLHGGICVENIGSWSVAEKLGFEFEGMRDQDFYLDGKYLGVKTYCLLKEDWLKRNKKTQE
ncbi:MAG: GNAT family N-acetyltransferase [Promethearchaeota archaeon]|nr:MAG: GNAT family N-acetyltransferase [Candidatus Lokiarchaeota archaeon]